MQNRRQNLYIIGRMIRDRICGYIRCLCTYEQLLARENQKEYLHGYSENKNRIHCDSHE